MITRIPEGSVILTPQEAKILCLVLPVTRRRSELRVGNKLAYDVLTAISLAAFTDPAEHGTEPRQEPASEEREWWTVRQLHQRMKRYRSERAIRNDCANGNLPAQKNPSWLIKNEDAQTYIAAHRPK